MNESKLAVRKRKLSQGKMADSGGKQISGTAIFQAHFGFDNTWWDKQNRHTIWLHNLHELSHESEVHKQHNKHV